MAKQALTKGGKDRDKEKTSTNAVLRKGRVQYNRWHIVPRIDLKVHTECAVDGYVVCTGAPAVRGIDGVSWTGSMPLIPLLNLRSIGLDHHIQHFYTADSHSFTHVAHREMHRI